VYGYMCRRHAPTRLIKASWIYRGMS